MHRFVLIIVIALAVLAAAYTGVSDAARKAGIGTPPPVVEVSQPLNFHGAMKIVNPTKYTQRQERMLNQMSQVLVDKLVAHGVQFYMCDCVPATDLPEVADLLRGAPAPLGYPEGQGWQNVDGMYLPDVRLVVVGRTGNDGSLGLALHETAHAIYDVYRIDLNPDLARHYRRQLSGIEGYGLLPGYWKDYYELAAGRGKGEWFADTFAAHLRFGKRWTRDMYGNAYANWLDGLVTALSDAGKERV